MEPLLPAIEASLASFGQEMRAKLRESHSALNSFRHDLISMRREVKDFMWDFEQYYKELKSITIKFGRVEIQKRQVTRQLNTMWERNQDMTTIVNAIKTKGEALRTGHKRLKASHDELRQHAKNSISIGCTLVNQLKQAFEDQQRVTDAARVTSQQVLHENHILQKALLVERNRSQNLLREKQLVLRELDRLETNLESLQNENVALVNRNNRLRETNDKLRSQSQESMQPEITVAFSDTPCEFTVESTDDGEDNTRGNQWWRKIAVETYKEENRNPVLKMSKNQFFAWDIKLHFAAESPFRESRFWCSILKTNLLVQVKHLTVSH
eukprot:g78126.t1